MDFVKMQGLGNDFIVMEDWEEKIPWSSEDVRKICDRHFGIGADGLIVVRPSKIYDIKMSFYNQDGTEAAMCGNGVRCFAKYVYEKGIVNQPEFSIETIAGKITPKISGEWIQVHMGKPEYHPGKIPVRLDQESVIDKRLDMDGENIMISTVLVGVPHTIIEVETLAQYPVEKIGRFLESHPLFPRKTNVNFVEILSQTEINMVTWERGAGLTLACGTGASAVAALLHKKGKIQDEVLVHLPGGQLTIKIIDGDIYMIGGAEEVFTGHIHLKDLI